MLQQLAHPLSVTLGLLGLGLVLLAWRRRRTAAALLVIALAGTWLMATPFAAHRLAHSLERRYPPTPVERIPGADAIVVLGGGVYPEAAPGLGPNLTHAADRIWFGARLYAAGKAPLIIATGARPYANAGPSAAAAQREVLRALGVPGEVVVAPGESVRTRTDATIARTIVERRGLGRVLLVTSALHMPRALATFRAAGVRAFPAPTDFEAAQAPIKGEYAWLPDAQAFWRSGRVVHEYIGLAWYRWQGWL